MANTALAQGDSAPHKIYDAKTMTLDNGMQVVVVKNPRTPAVTHMVWYRIGGADEVMGHSGLAHYLEHLMFKGSERVPDGEFSKRVKSWGGNDNAFTSWDFTAYFQTVPKTRLRDVMVMEADRMQTLSFTDEDALTERDVVVQERKQRTDSNPSAQLSESMRAALFPNHPYGRPIIGWDHEVNALTPQAARDFYRQYYAPRNAILVVSGDVTAEDVFAKAEEIYGMIANGTAETRPAWPDVPHIYGDMTITHAHSSVKQPVWRKIYRAPSIGQDYQRALALTIAGEILGGNTGRLYNHLVVDNPITSNVGFYYSGVSVEDSTISLSATPLPERDFTAIETAVAEVFADIADHGVTAEDITKAANKLIDQSVYERDSLTGPAMMLGYQLSTGMSLDQAETWIHDLNSVTPQDVQNVVRDYLMPNSEDMHSVTGYLIPKNEE